MRSSNSKEYAINHTGLTPDRQKKATRKPKAKRTIAKENKKNGTTKYT